MLPGICDAVAERLRLIFFDVAYSGSEGIGCRGILRQADVLSCRPFTGFYAYVDVPDVPCGFRLGRKRDAETAYRSASFSAMASANSDGSRLPII